MLSNIEGLASIKLKMVLRYGISLPSQSEQGIGLSSLTNPSFPKVQKPSENLNKSQISIRTWTCHTCVLMLVKVVMVVEFQDKFLTLGWVNSVQYFVDIDSFQEPQKFGKIGVWKVDYFDIHHSDK